MPPKRNPRPITQIKRTGELDQDFIIFEGEELSSKVSDAIKEIKDHLILEKKTTTTRRTVQKQEDSLKNDLKDIKNIIGTQLQRIKFEKKQNKQKLEKLKQNHINLKKDIALKKEQLNSSFKLEFIQLKNNLQNLIIRRENNANIAAQENQLRREILEAQNTLLNEKKTQSQQMSTALDDFYQLHQNHIKEIEESTLNEIEKNTNIRDKNIKKTVVEMMKEIEFKKNKLSLKVRNAKQLSNKNNELMEKNKQLIMNKDLYQKDFDTLIKKINNNDEQIKILVEELKEFDQKLSNITETPIIEEIEEDLNIENRNNEEDILENQIDNREEKLIQFFNDSINTLCLAIINILSIIDPNHTNDYFQFHQAFNSFNNREKELKFLLSKIGNISFDSTFLTVTHSFECNEIEGKEDDYVLNNLIEPQNKAIFDFSSPIKLDEFPKVIASHFFN